MLTYFLHLPRVPSIRAWAVVGDGVRAGEFVVTRRRGDDISLAGDLARKPAHGARDLFFARVNEPHPAEI